MSNENCDVEKTEGQDIVSNFFNSDELGSLLSKEVDYMNFVNQVYYFSKNWLTTLFYWL